MVENTDIFFPIPARLPEEAKLLVGDQEAQDVDGRNTHAKSAEPDVEAPLQGRDVLEPNFPPLPDLRFQEEFPRRSPPNGEEKGLDRNPNEELERNQTLEFPKRKMACGEDPKPPEKKEEERVVEKTGQKTDPGVDAGGILPGQPLPVDDDLRRLYDSFAHTSVS